MTTHQAASSPRSLGETARPAGTTTPAGPRPLRLGSLCTGYGGLDMAAAQVLDVELAWVADPDPGAAATLAHHHPNVPNLGDITAVDWTAVPPVDVLAAGFPCQDISYAGRGAGIKEGTRSGLWYTIADALRVLRPRLLVLENVRAIVSRRPGLDVVLADLARLGFDAEWTCVRASDSGAPHQRWRWFCAAWPADTDGPRLEGRRVRRATPERRGAVPDAHGAARSERRQPAPGQAEGGRARPDTRGRGGAPAADPSGDGRNEGRPEPARLVRRPDAAVRSGATRTGNRDGAPARRAAAAGRATHDRVLAVQVDDVHPLHPGALGDGVGVGRPPAGHQLDTEPCEGGAHLTFDALGRDSMRVHGGDERHHIDSGDLHGLDSLSRRPRTQQPAENPSTWGPYAAAIHRWEHVTGRPAPPPTEPGRNGQPRLSPAFVEWLMGLPAGWVTRVPGLSRNQQLRLLGNGVVPQQGAAAIALLLDRMEY